MRVVRYIKNMKCDQLSFVMVTCVSVWLGLLVSTFYLNNDTSIASAIGSKLDFIFHAATLFYLISTWKVTAKVNDSAMRWFVGINAWLLIVDIFFYIAAYSDDSLLLKMSAVNFILYFAPCIIYSFLMIFFISKILTKEVMKSKDFLKIVSSMMVINITILLLFLSSIHYAFEVMSFETISQIILLSVLLLLFSFEILGLIYSKNPSITLFFVGGIILIAGDFFLTYSYISQTVNLFSYGSLFWGLGLICIFFSAFSMHLKGLPPINEWFRKSSAIKSRLAFWVFSISILSFLLFFIFTYIFDIVNKQFFIGLPLFFMIYSIIMITLSLWMGRVFDTPFRQMAANIEAVMLKNNDKMKNETFLIDEFVYLQKHILDVFEVKEGKDRIKKQLGEFAAKIAHDIRSPLAIMDLTLLDLKEKLPAKDCNTLNEAVQSVREIANNLLIKHRASDETDPLYQQGLNEGDQVRFVLLSRVIDSVAHYKRQEWKMNPCNLTVDIKENARAAWVLINPNDLERVLSNLLNNAYEALMDERNITICLTIDDDELLVLISDTGIGIAEDKIELALSGKSFNKAGNGLGLSSAVSFMKSIGGSLNLESVINMGTTISLRFSHQKQPGWFPSSIEVTKNELVVILDDDPSVHQLWKNRFFQYPVTTIHFLSISEFKTWFGSNSHNNQQVHYLIDYDFSDNEYNGIYLLRELNLAKRGYLVTNHAEEGYIQDECSRSNISLLPKILMGYLPILMH